METVIGMRTGRYPSSCWKRIKRSMGVPLETMDILSRLAETMEWYYLNPANGVMMIGWQAINGQWYYMNGSGQMQTGWQLVLFKQRRSNAYRLAAVRRPVVLYFESGEWCYDDGLAVY